MSRRSRNPHAPPSGCPSIAPRATSPSPSSTSARAPRPRSSEGLPRIRGEDVISSEEIHVSPSVALRRALALAFVLAQPAWAAPDPEIDKIRDEIREMKSSYESRIQALEQRLKDAEAKAASAPAPAAPAAATPANSIAAFNPAVSVVLQGSYANLSSDPRRFALSGFLPAAEIGPGKRGFSLGESELAMFANVDDKFSGNLIASLTPDDKVSVEEAYGIWMTAPYGIVPKFGRFFSGLGYLNEQHQHAWDFFDAPLAYQAFLGGQ